MAQVTTRGDIRWLVRVTRFADEARNPLSRQTKQVLQQFDGQDWVDVPIVKETEQWLASGKDRRVVPKPPNARD